MPFVRSFPRTLIITHMAPKINPKKPIIRANFEIKPQFSANPY